MPGPEDPAVDVFGGPGNAVWAFSAPTNVRLDPYVADVIAKNFQEHGDTCPEEPESIEPVTIGGEPGKLIAWNCGILINVAAVIHDGTGFHFPMRDPNVHAATDPKDHATLVSMLESVVFAR